MLGIWRFDLYGRTAYLYSLAVLFVLFLLARLLVASPFGLSLRGIRGNARRARGARRAGEARGSRAAYAIAAAYAGVAGALLAQTTQFVSLDVLSFQRSAEGLLMLVLGGLGSLYGALLGRRGLHLRASRPVARRARCSGSSGSASRWSRWRWPGAAA